MIVLRGMRPNGRPVDMFLGQKPTERLASI
jgi:hypothetical protein